jgi:hypothetical protein
MTNQLFSSYSQGENRITSTILAVFERLNSSVVEFILADLMEDSNIELLKYRNQAKAKSGESIPDGLITASFAYYIETKIKPNSLKTNQLQNHIKHLERELKIKDSRLIVITPDYKQPEVIKELDDERIYWCNFDMLVDSFGKTFSNNDLLLSEREAYLLQELKRLIENEPGLLTDNVKDRVLLIPARNAIEEYKLYGAYFCQPNRSFKPSYYLAFYHSNRIDRKIPTILGYIESIRLGSDEVDPADFKEVSGDKGLLTQKFHQLEKKLKEDNHIRLQDDYKIMMLSSMNDPETVNLDNDIPNDKLSSSGKPTAFVQNQRYVSLEKLTEAKHTTDLE